MRPNKALESPFYVYTIHPANTAAKGKTKTSSLRSALLCDQSHADASCTRFEGERLTASPLSLGWGELGPPGTVAY